jgi:hypothetical protein
LRTHTGKGIFFRSGKLPNVNQVTEALRLYNALLNAIYGDDAGESLADWPLGTFGNETPNYVFPYTDYAVTHPTINRRLIATTPQRKPSI